MRGEAGWWRVDVYFMGTHEKYFWYVRTGLGTELREVPRGGGEFADVMSAFFAANPALAARVRQREEGARFENTVELACAYNMRATAK